MTKAKGRLLFLKMSEHHYALQYLYAYNSLPNNILIHQLYNVIEIVYYIN